MLSRWARGICYVLLVAAASGTVTAPAKPGLALSISSPEVRRKSPGGFGRLKRTRGNVAETASLLDDSDEEILDFCGVSRRAVWLAMVWALPVSLAPLAILIQPFRSAVWYRILAIALAKSGELDTFTTQAAGNQSRILGGIAEEVMPSHYAVPFVDPLVALISALDALARGLQGPPLSSGANGLQCAQTCFPYACVPSSRISIPMPRGTFQQILSCLAASAAAESLQTLSSPLCLLTRARSRHHDIRILCAASRSSKIRSSDVGDDLAPGTHGITR